MLTGETKKLCQRNYMRNKRMMLKPIPVANKQVVKTQVDADGNVIYDD